MDNSIEIYIKYVDEQLQEIAHEVNSKFESTKEYIRAKLLHTIREYLTPLPVHFEWR